MSVEELKKQLLKIPGVKDAAIDDDEKLTITYSVDKKATAKNIEGHVIDAKAHNQITDLQLAVALAHSASKVTLRFIDYVADVDEV